MRAIYLENDISDLKAGETFLYKGDETHHLINVARIQIGEEVLILNGRGLKVISVVLEIAKKKVLFEVKEVIQVDKHKGLTLALGTPKKEAFSEILKFCVEIGIEKIIPLKTQYSQPLKLNDEKLQKIISSALIQSNNPWPTEINPVLNWSEFEKLIGNYENVVVFSPNGENLEKSIKIENTLMIIGPEGGLSNEEIKSLKERQVMEVGLPTSILRAPTAVCVASGFLFGKGI